MASLIHAVAHGLVAGDTFKFANVLPDTSGVDEDTIYYVLAASLTADAFTFSTAAAGTSFILTEAITDGSLIHLDTYAEIADGIMDAPTAPAAPASCVLSSAAVLLPDGTTVSRLDVTIVQPTSATLRHTVVTITGGSNAVKVVIPVGQTTGSIASVVPGITYTGSAVSYDTFGLASGATVSAGHVAAGDTTAPSQVTSLAALGAIRGVLLSWAGSSATDLSHYEVQVDASSGFGTATTYKSKTSVLSLTQMTTGLWYFRVRAVDLSGNLGTYSATVSATSRLVAGGTADIEAGSITANDVHAGAITADKLLVGGGTFLTNPDFESGDFTGWSYGNSGGGGSSAIGSDPLWRAQGGYYATFASTATGYAELAQRVGGFHYGDYIQVSALMANSIGARLAVEWQDSAGAVISSEFSAFLNNPDTGGYGTTGPLRKTATFGPAPAATVYARIILVNQSVSTTLLVDDVWLSRVGDLITPNGNVKIDSTGITISNGALTIQDEFAKTVMVSSGFSGNWADFIATGLYNGRFLSGTAGALAVGRTSALPYWTMANTTGSPVATFVTDGGVAVTFAALSNKKTFTSDSVQVHPAAIYQAAFTVSATKGVAAMFVILAVFIDWFKADGTASSTATTTLDTSSFGATISATAINNLLPVRPPTDARFAKLRFTVEESSFGSHDANHKLTLLSASFKEVGNTTVGRGAAFPTTPAPVTYDRFFHTGYQQEFFYQGSRWVTSALYSKSMPAGSVSSFTATTSNLAWVPMSLAVGASDIWLEEFDAMFFVNTGATALSGSHSWALSLDKGVEGSASFTTIATCTLNSGANGNRKIATTISALLNNGTVHAGTRINLTKVGTPGAVFVGGELFYRLVAT